jgi:ribosomal protein L28
MMLISSLWRVEEAGSASKKMNDKSKRRRFVNILSHKFVS